MKPSLIARKVRQAIILGRAKVGTENTSSIRSGTRGAKIKVHMTMSSTIAMLTVLCINRYQTVLPKISLQIINLSTA